MSKLIDTFNALAATIENEDSDILIWAEEMGDDELLAQAAQISAKAATELRKLAKLYETKMTFDLMVEAETILPTDIEELAAMAKEFDASDDPFLQKQATVIDQLLINFSQKGLKALGESAEEAELAKLRAEYRTKASDKAYKEPREIHEKDIKAADAAKAIKDQIKEYRPLEAGLSTRYCPDHPGNQVRRIADYIYQCSLDKKLYNYQEGFTTIKGNKVPGTDVSRQTQHLGDRALEEMHFSTREARLGDA